jgi:hypothetical protein
MPMFHGVLYTDPLNPGVSTNVNVAECLPARDGEVLDTHWVESVYFIQTAVSSSKARTAKPS